MSEHTQATGTNSLPIARDSHTTQRTLSERSRELREWSRCLRVAMADNKDTLADLSDLVVEQLNDRGWRS